MLLQCICSLIAVESLIVIAVIRPIHSLLRHKAAKKHKNSKYINLMFN